MFVYANTQAAQHTVSQIVNKTHISYIPISPYGVPVWPDHLTTVPGLCSSAPPWVRAYGRAGSARLGWCRSRGWLPGSSHPQAHFRRGPWQHGNSVFKQLWLTQVLSCFRLLASGFNPAPGCAVGVKHSPIEVRCKKHRMTAHKHLCSVEVKSACFSYIKPFESRHRQAVSLKTVVNINTALDLAWTREQNTCAVESCLGHVPVLISALGHCCFAFTPMMCRFTSHWNSDQVPTVLSSSNTGLMFCKHCVKSLGAIPLVTSIMKANFYQFVLYPKSGLSLFSRLREGNSRFY